jgi:hypothetical protein
MSTIQPFTGAARLSQIRPCSLRKYYNRLLAKDWYFRVVNRRYIARLSLVDSLGPLTEAGRRVVGDLRRDGIAFAQVDEFLPIEVFQRLKDNFYATLAQADKAEWVKNGETKTYIVRLGGDCVLHNDDPMTQFAILPEFAKISAHYMGMVPRFSGTRMWHTIPIADNEQRVASQQWHRDFNDQRFVKIFLYLNDVDSGSGPLEYIKETHHDGRYGRVLADKLKPSLGTRDYVTDAEMEPYYDELRSNHVQCVGSSGTLTFVDTFGFHRGGKCETGVRDVVISHYNTNANTFPIEHSCDPKFQAPANTFMRLVLGLDE